MAAQARIEPASAFLQAAVNALSCESGQGGGAQHGAQILRDLAEVVRTWESVPAQIRFAVLALVRTANGGGAG